MDAITKSQSPTSLEVTFWEDVIVRTVTTVACLAISAISFYFAALLMQGVITITSPILANVAIGTAITLGCVAIYFAYTSATTPTGTYRDEYEVDNSPVKSNNLSTSKTATKTGSKTKTTPVKKPKFEETEASGNGLKDSITKSQCSYDNNGKVDSDKLLYKTGVAKKHMNWYLAYIERTSKQKNLDSDPSFFEITRMMGDVRGDGNCGYYSMFCVWAYHAYEDADFLKNLLIKIEEAFPIGASIKLFNREYTTDDLTKLKDDVLEIFRKIPDASIDTILTEKNGKKLNEFMRAAILANPEKLCVNLDQLDFIAQKDKALKPLTTEEQIGYSLALDDIQNDDEDDDGAPLNKIAKPNAYMTEAVSQALCFLFDTEVKTINFLTKKFANPENSKKPIEVDSLIFPAIPDGGQKKPIIGYLVYVGGHYIFALPRKDGQ